jgi:cyclic pyranopterin phosphate synthase
MSDHGLTHLNARGEAHMVDVGDKPATRRVAVADGLISMHADSLRRVRDAAHAKGDVLAVARIAGIQAAKRTAELIPLCHNIPLTHVDIRFDIDDTANTIRCTAEAATVAATGVEMEALTAVQIALLTIYDMCKAVDRGMRMHDIALVSKSGGRSGDWVRRPAQE